MVGYFCETHQSWGNTLPVLIIMLRELAINSCQNRPAGMAEPRIIHKVLTAVWKIQFVFLLKKAPEMALN